MTVQDLIDELRRFNPHDSVGVELTPEAFITMDEDPLCFAVDKIEAGNVAIDGYRAKLVLGEIS